MLDVATQINQQEELNKLLAEYEPTIRDLYSDILNLYSEQGVQLSKAAMIGEIKDKVKEAAV